MSPFRQGMLLVDDASVAVSFVESGLVLTWFRDGPAGLKAVQCLNGDGNTATGRQPT